MSLGLDTTALCDEGYRKVPCCIWERIAYGF
jgi:hypothetical protein